MKFWNKLGIFVLVLLILADDAAAVYRNNDTIFEIVVFTIVLGVGGAMLLYEKKNKSLW